MSADEGGDGTAELHVQYGWMTRLLLRVYKRIGADPSEPEDDVERWPTTRQAFLWDLLPDKPAPRRDGVVAPKCDRPTWVDNVAEDELDSAIADERAAHLQEKEFVAAVEGKATRLLTPSVTLLTGAVALAAFELKAAAASRTLPGATLPLCGAAFATGAIIWLFMSVLRALDADTRMGVYVAWSPELRLHGKAEMLAAEAVGTRLASWTRGRKAMRLMTARVAVSRAVVMLVVALILGALTVVTRASDSPSHARNPSVAPSTKPSNPTPSVTQRDLPTVSRTRVVW